MIKKGTRPKKGKTAKSNILLDVPLVPPPCEVIEYELFKHLRLWRLSCEINAI